MTGLADLNLVLARIWPDDALHDRAVDHLEETSGDLTVPLSVGVELLFVCVKHGIDPVEALGAAEAHFDVERRDVLYTAAEALEVGDVSTVFDAVHAAEALDRGGALHTADAEVLESPFPTEGF